MFLKSIIQGDTYSFQVDPTTDQLGQSISYPQWTCSISFRGNANTLDVTADPNWKITLLAAQTNLLKVGRGFYQIYATNISTGQRVTIDQGSVEIKANFSSQDASFDGRSQVRKDLETVQGLIRQIILTGGVAEYRIGTRLARKYDLGELRALESTLLSRLAREERAQSIANGLGDPENLYVRFGN